MGPYPETLLLCSPLMVFPHGILLGRWCLITSQLLKANVQLKSRCISLLPLNSFNKSPLKTFQCPINMELQQERRSFHSNFYSNPPMRWPNYFLTSSSRTTKFNWRNWSLERYYIPSLPRSHHTLKKLILEPWRWLRCSEPRNLEMKACFSSTGTCRAILRFTQSGSKTPQRLTRNFMLYQRVVQCSQGRHRHRHKLNQREKWNQMQLHSPKFSKVPQRDKHWLWHLAMEEVSRLLKPVDRAKILPSLFLQTLTCITLGNKENTAKLSKSFSILKKKRQPLWILGLHLNVQVSWVPQRLKQNITMHHPKRARLIVSFQRKTFWKEFLWSVGTMFESMSTKLCHPLISRRTQKMNFWRGSDNLSHSISKLELQCQSKSTVRRPLH